MCDLTPYGFCHQLRGPTVWQYRALYYYPPARLPDFVLGVLAAH
eukprot:SAG31_NODE_22209_length_531_cov_1.023148_1_plen_43_part_10